MAVDFTQPVVGRAVASLELSDLRPEVADGNDVVCGDACDEPGEEDEKYDRVQATEVDDVPAARTL